MDFPSPVTGRSSTADYYITDEAEVESSTTKNPRSGYGEIGHSSRASTFDNIEKKQQPKGKKPAVGRGKKTNGGRVTKPKRDQSPKVDFNKVRLDIRYPFQKLTDDMTPEQREAAIEANRRNAQRRKDHKDDRDRNNHSASKSRTKKLLNVVELDNAIIGYEYNIKVFKNLYERCKEIIIALDHQNLLPAEPRLWKRPLISRELIDKIAESRSQIEEKVVKGEFVELGAEFAEVCAKLVGKKTGEAILPHIYRGLDDNNRKEQELAKQLETNREQAQELDKKMQGLLNEQSSVTKTTNEYKKKLQEALKKESEAGRGAGDEAESHNQHILATLEEEALDEDNDEVIRFVEAPERTLEELASTFQVRESLLAQEREELQKRQDIKGKEPEHVKNEPEDSNVLHYEPFTVNQSNSFYQDAQAAHTGGLVTANPPQHHPFTQRRLLPQQAVAHTNASEQSSATKQASSPYTVTEYGAFSQASGAEQLEQNASGNPAAARAPNPYHGLVFQHLGRNMTQPTGSRLPHGLPLTTNTDTHAFNLDFAPAGNDDCNLFAITPGASTATSEDSYVGSASGRTAVPNMLPHRQQQQQQQQSFRMPQNPMLSGAAIATPVIGARQYLHQFEHVHDNAGFDATAALASGHAESENVNADGDYEIDLDNGGFWHLANDVYPDDPLI
ncbi:hypothetical protein B0T22DRAFT_479340 [Podospora appendiculata]|uniref:BZIP domain-containing protein n=1 Tax=Podospora appendiculata TaxID=314037 RepID=A0AAE1CC32_9PEZI|nr:hypothetical protein B0T22DRAFT_479340 [Podospora appendiculata]